MLLCNLGTPDEATAPALRRYLAEFLSDPRVVEIPKPLWWLILHGIILRVRPKKSAAKYASIWMKEGSPLRVWTQKQAVMLRGWPAVRGHPVEVRYAMRYGNPSIASQLDQLKADGVERVLILPAYPQYSGTTTASVFDAVYRWAARIRRIPEFRFVNHYHDHEGYIKALAARVREHWRTQGRAEQLVMSFHGVPERTLALGDPYHCECHKTARLLAAQLGLEPAQYKVTFQSRSARPNGCSPIPNPRWWPWRRPASSGSTWSARASPATAWRRWKKSTWKRARPFCTRAARSSATSPASTTAMNGSPGWPTSRSSTWRAGRRSRPTQRHWRLRANAPWPWARPSKPSGPLSPQALSLSSCTISCVVFTSKSMKLPRSGPDIQDCSQ